MDKEKILEMSRKENKNKNLVDAAAEKTASSAAGISMTVLCLIFQVAERMILRNNSHSFFAIISLYCAVFFTVKGIKTKSVLNIIAGILWTLITIASIAEHIGYLFSSAKIL